MIRLAIGGDSNGLGLVGSMVLVGVGLVGSMVVVRGGSVLRGK